MDIRILERNTDIHRAIADSFKTSFNRAWQRPLTPVEVSTIESATLCLTFMRLELVGIDLDRSETVEAANEVYEFLAKEVAVSLNNALRAFEEMATEVGLPLPAKPHANLLVLEELLLAYAKNGSPGA